MNDKTIETEIQSKGLTAPRITPQDVAAEIVSEHFFTALEAAYSDGALNLGDTKKAIVSLPLLTICVLVLENGFTVTGESACASPENFDADIGRKIAREKAVEKIWPLLGFRLRDFLADQADEAEDAGEPEVAQPQA